LPPAVQALAAGDLERFAAAFRAAGWRVRTPQRGILQLCQSGSGARLKVLVSVGVHGDETAPIEILAQMLDRLCAEPAALRVDLMVAVGNLDAIAAGKRFIEADLNRMFRPGRGPLASAAEAVRADALMQAAASFFGHADAGNWHLDLHTAIRPSRYPTFAVVPQAATETRDAEMLAWLGQAGIEAAILNRSTAGASGTFSAWTAAQFDARACTLELGRIGTLGSNDLDRFAGAAQALGALLRNGIVEKRGVFPQVFEVTQELIKRSAAFRMHCGSDTPNFTPFAPGSVIAEDGVHIYRAGARTEYVVFPNPDVRVGLRAGLMVTARS
jgi:succinylglutamate desuccinylase